MVGTPTSVAAMAPCTAPGVAVNVKIEEAVFTLHSGALKVNGSLLTEVHVVARVYSRYTAEASFFASQLSALERHQRHVCRAALPFRQASTEERSASS